MRKLSKEQKQQIAAVAAKKDADIDLTEMPEVADWSRAEVGRFYSPKSRPRVSSRKLALNRAKTRG